MEQITYLKDTVGPMLSADYQDRFRAEYYQLKIRHERLRLMLERWDAGTLSFNPTCSKDLLNRQLSAMSMYLLALEERAQVEGVEL